MGCAQTCANKLRKIYLFVNLKTLQVKEIEVKPRVPLCPFPATPTHTCQMELSGHLEPQVIYRQASL